MDLIKNQINKNDLWCLILIEHLHLHLLACWFDNERNVPATHKSASHPLTKEDTFILMRPQADNLRALRGWGSFPVHLHQQDDCLGSDLVLICVSLRNPPGCIKGSFYLVCETREKVEEKSWSPGADGVIIMESLMKQTKEETISQLVAQAHKQLHTQTHTTHIYRSTSHKWHAHKHISMVFNDCGTYMQLHTIHIHTLAIFTHTKQCLQLLLNGC